MAYTTIDDPAVYFTTVLWTGNATGRSITTGMYADMVWYKGRSYISNNSIVDSVRGTTKVLIPNNTDAEATDSGSITAFNSTNFTIGTAGGINGNTKTYAAWCWNTQGGAGSSNEAGTINSTTTSVGQTQGISISTYTGTNTAATIGHGLGAVPKMVIVKRTNGAAGWYVHHHNLTSANYHIILNTTAAQGTGTYQWNDTLPTSTVFSVGTGSDTNGSSDTYVAYCFAPKQGFSKFGSYIGNGNADGVFVYTGFKPAFLLAKCSSTTAGGAGNWYIFDGKRAGYNFANYSLKTNSTDAEATSTYLELLSNGFKIRNAAADLNGSGNTHIYMAFAEAPFVNSNGVPCNAR